MFGLLSRGNVGAATYSKINPASAAQKLRLYLWSFSGLNGLLLGLEHIGVVCTPMVVECMILVAVLLGTYSHYCWDKDCWQPVRFFHWLESFYAAIDYVLVLASVWALGISAYITLLNPMLLILCALFVFKRVLRMVMQLVDVQTVLRDIVLVIVLAMSLYCYLGDISLLQRAPLRAMQFLPDMGFFLCLCYYETPDSQAMFSLANIASWPKYMVYMFF